MKRLAFVVLLGGCGLYMGGGGDDDICLPTPKNEPAQLLRNPETGACEAVGGGECGPCGPCSEGAGLEPNWASCGSTCEALAENSCLVTAGCRAAYRDFPGADAAPEFIGCWGVAPSGPVQGSCAGLGAQQCSEHDNCSAWYVATDGTNNQNAPRMEFEQCVAEPSGNDPGTCYGPVTCESPSPLCPAGTTAGISNGCYTGFCIPLSQCEPAACETLPTEAACANRSDCTPVYIGMNCTCTPNNGCHCETQTYDRCESLAMPL
jgi:hypothetical protein